MSVRRIAPLPLVAFATFFAIAACSDTVEPDRFPAPDAASAKIGQVLVECPSAETRVATGILSARGGSLRLGGHEMRAPAAAVGGPTPFELREPASNHLEIRVRAGNAAGYRFRTPVTITIDYSRCTRSNIDKAPLTVWKIDPETRALLVHMGGTDDKLARTVTFQTDHLSTFSIAR